MTDPDIVPGAAAEHVWKAEARLVRFALGHERQHDAVSRHHQKRR